MTPPIPIRARATPVNDDDDDVFPTSGGDGILLTSPTPIRAPATLVNDDDDDVSPTSGGDGEVIATPVRRGHGSKPVSVNVHDSMDALLQVHLQWVRNRAVPGMDAAAQHAEAEAGLARQCVEEEARLRQAQTKLTASQERLKEAEQKLALCETDERALDGLLSESNPLNHRLTQSEVKLALSLCMADENAWNRLLAELMVAPVRRGRDNQSTPVAADQDDEMILDTQDIVVDIESMDSNDQAKEASSAADAKHEERLARARLRRDRHLLRREAALAQAEAQREVALVEARARLEAATAQLAKVAAEVTAAALEEREAADASAKAWSQVHMMRVQKGTAAQRAEAEVCAARERAEEEERLQQARATLQGAKKRLRQTERELALCVTEEKALHAESTPSPPSDQEGPSGQRTSDEGNAGGDELSVGQQEARLSVRPFVRLSVRLSRLSGSSVKAAKREERLQRARGQLGFERRRRDVAIAKTEAAEVTGSAGAASGSSFASASAFTSAAHPSLTSRNDVETAASLNQQAENLLSTSCCLSMSSKAAIAYRLRPPPPPKETKLASQLSAQQWLARELDEAFPSLPRKGRLGLSPSRPRIAIGIATEHDEEKSKLAAQLSAQQWLSREMEAPPSSSRKGRLGGNPSRRRAAIGIATEQDSTRSSNLSSTRSRDNEEVDNEPGGLLAPQSPDRGSSSATAQDGVAVPRAAWKITRFARFVARI